MYYERREEERIVQTYEDGGRRTKLASERTSQGFGGLCSLSLSLTVLPISHAVELPPLESIRWHRHHRCRRHRYLLNVVAILAILIGCCWCSPTRIAQVMQCHDYHWFLVSRTMYIYIYIHSLHIHTNTYIYTGICV